MAADQEGIGRNQSECKGASVKFWQMEFSPQAREERASGTPLWRQGLGDGGCGESVDHRPP